MMQPSELPEGWQKLPEIELLLEQTVAQATDALTRQRDELQAEVQRLTGQLERFAGLDPDSIREALARQAEDDERRLLAEGRLEEILQQRLKSQRADDERRIAAMQERINALDEELKAKNRTLALESVSNGIRAAVAEIGELHKEAWPDVQARALAVFTINDAGEIEPRDTEGNLLYGKDGVSALTYEEWARRLHDEAPHLFKATGRGSDEPHAPADTPGATGRPVVLHGDQAKNPLTYRRARELANRRGVQLVIQ